MKCKRFEDLMLRHFEKTITPEDARELTKHVLLCAPCRELYLAMDEAGELAADTDGLRDDFTARVMTAVRAEKPHSPAQSFAPRIFAAVNMLLFGIGFLFALNPDLLHALPHPIVDRLLYALTSVGAFLITSAERLSQTGSSFSLYGATALFIVAVTGTLLFVLHSGEKIET